MQMNVNLYDKVDHLTTWPTTYNFATLADIANPWRERDWAAGLHQQEATRALSTYKIDSANKDPPLTNFVSIYFWK